MLSFDLFYIQIRREFDSEIFLGIQYSEAGKFHYDMYSGCDTAIYYSNIEQ